MPEQISTQDPMNPSASLLCKLGSIAVHVEEFLSPGRHEFDIAALKTLLSDEEVVRWISIMDKTGFLPKKRGSR